MDPESDIRSDWNDWTQFILTMSPALRAFVRERPLQYPFLTRMLDTIQSATTGVEMAEADLPRGSSEAMWGPVGGHPADPGGSRSG